MIELKGSGCTAAALREVFEVREKRVRGVAKELKLLGFSDEELLTAGFTWRAVEAVNGRRSVRELKEQEGYEVTELREHGLVVADLRGIYTVKSIKDQGFDLTELREGGMPEHAVLAVDGRPTRELREAGYTAQVLRKIGYELYELVEGTFTAAELRQAGYGVSELKEVGFTAGALRVAEFTSRQLHAARYTLREMQEGGYSWKDLVIFLRTTHAELTRAGYTELDPLHELFMLYREKEDEQLIHDMSILSPRYLSPRYTARGQQDVVASPRAGALDRTERYVEVGSTPLKVRQGVALTSKFIGLVSQGTRLRVLDSRIWRRDGTRRVCVASTESEESQAPAILPLGWVTASKLTPAGKPPPAPSPASSSPPYLNPMEC